MTVWIERRATLTPNRLALVTRERRVTWSELCADVRGTAEALAALGVRRGDLLATLLDADESFVRLFHAAGRLGAVLCPLNTRWTAHELRRALRHARARWLVHSGPLIDRARVGVDGLHRIAAEELRPPLRSASGGAPVDAIELATPLAVVHTSGTSAVARGVVLSHANFLWSAAGSSMHLGAHADDLWLCCVPPFHVAGLSILARAVLFGAGIVLHERFDAEAVSATLDREPITLVSWVPTMLQQLLDVRGSHRAPATLRCVLLGGGPIPERLLEDAWSRGWPVTPTYGLTETTGQVATLPLVEVGRRAGARPLLPVEVRVVDAGGRPEAPGCEGEIEVRGPTLMVGYHRRREETMRAFRDGWLRTGDLGRFDEDGFLHVVARRSDLIVSGGENIVPMEVEDVLREHPGVADVGVAAEMDDRLGQRVSAWIVSRSERRPSIEELQDFCRERLAGYKLPRAIHFVKGLPRTPSGKLQRRLLRASSPLGAHVDDLHDEGA